MDHLLALPDERRQVLFDESDVTNNMPKAEAAVIKMRQINSGVKLEAIVADINRTNIEEFSRDADLILDGTDNFEVRYTINDVAVKLGKPWIYGGAVGYLSFNGDLDTAIHIRTALIKDGQIHIQAGGGTVADADPEYEYRESVNKAKAMFRAVEMACENPDWA